MVIEVCEFHSQSNNQTYVHKQQLAPLHLSVGVLYSFLFPEMYSRGNFVNCSVREWSLEMLELSGLTDSSFQWILMSLCSLGIPLYIQQELKWKTTLGIIHSIPIRENNPQVPNLAVRVFQSRENSKNVSKPSILTQNLWGIFPLAHRIWTTLCDCLGVSLNKSLLLGLRQWQ